MSKKNEVPQKFTLGRMPLSAKNNFVIITLLSQIKDIDGKEKLEWCLDLRHGYLKDGITESEAAEWLKNPKCRMEITPKKSSKGKVLYNQKKVEYIDKETKRKKKKNVMPDDFERDPDTGMFVTYTKLGFRMPLTSVPNFLSLINSAMETAKEKKLL